MCNFGYAELDLVALAQGFALPHLPRMPELRATDTSAFVPHPTPANDIPFKNKARQKARLARLAREGTCNSLLLLLHLLLLLLFLTQPHAK